MSLRHEAYNCVGVIWGYYFFFDGEDCTQYNSCFSVVPLLLLFIYLIRQKTGCHQKA